MVVAMYGRLTVYMKKTLRAKSKKEVGKRVKIAVRELMRYKNLRWGKLMLLYLMYII
jgi:hypothetical protein